VAGNLRSLTDPREYRLLGRAEGLARLPQCHVVLMTYLNHQTEPLCRPDLRKGRPDGSCPSSHLGTSGRDKGLRCER
jgi:hypothetical protein